MTSTIQIQTLLMEREDSLLKISDLEQKINAILGQPYPLAPPDELPSAHPRKKAKKKRQPAAPKAVKLRPLNPETESAYRIIYLQNQTHVEEIHLDAKALDRLINTSTQTDEPHRIETVHQNEDQTWESIETLWEAEGFSIEN